MEIKAVLYKPYTENEKMDFIVEYSHNLGYTIEETENELQALGYTEEEQEQQEKERIAMLFLRRGDVFRGLLKAKEVTKAQIGAMIEAMPETTQEEIVAKEMARIDFEDAIEFYRGNALVNTIGLALGITSEQLDAFFESNDYTKLT